MEIVGCIATSLNLSCVRYLCQDSFLLQVLMHNRCWLSGSVACLVTSFGVHYCSMFDWGCNGGSVYEHVYVILERSSASSSSREPAVLVRDVEGGSSRYC